MKILFLDDGKIPNLAIMKMSAYYKALGNYVVLDDFWNPSGQEADKVICSIVFTRSRTQVFKLLNIYPHMEIGGSGWDHYDLDTPEISRLTPEIEAYKPDYDLYTVDHMARRIKGRMKAESRRLKAQQLVDAGIGYTSRGCVRSCKFCLVPKKEGYLAQDSEIKDIINPRSNVLVLLDNNLTADPNCLDKLQEIRERKLVVDFCSGIDIRLLTPEFAEALSQVRMPRSIHYAWDLIPNERQVFKGISLLTRYIKTYRHMCYMLTGFNTSFEEDMYRFRKLTEAGITPYVMVFNQEGTPKHRHFARWVNGRWHKVTSFEKYEPWVKYQAQLQPSLFV